MRRNVFCFHRPQSRHNDRCRGRMPMKTGEDAGDIYNDDMSLQPTFTEEQ